MASSGFVIGNAVLGLVVYTLVVFTLVVLALVVLALVVFKTVVPGLYVLGMGHDPDVELFESVILVTRVVSDGARLQPTRFNKISTKDTRTHHDSFLFFLM